MAIMRAELELLAELRQLMDKPESIEKVPDERLQEIVIVLSTMVCGMVHKLNMRRRKRRREGGH